MSFIVAHQLNIMLFMCGMCGILAVMTVLTESLPNTSKSVLASMEIFAMLLLYFDRLSYRYKGDGSALGFYVVRISNGMVYFLQLMITCLVTRYLSDLYKNEAGVRRLPKQLMACDILFVVGFILIIVSQFTGLYYTFDENNRYQRAPFHFICYVIPFLMVLFQGWSVLKFRRKIRRRIAYSIMVCIALPTVASVLQFFFYGVSITNITMAAVVIIYYTHALYYLSEAARRARLHELEMLKITQKKESAMFEQTAEALANAIDAKDKYTRGHSARVALYSRQIAKKAGLTDKKCNQVYFAALLHDVGKIGIRNDIINKVGRLTDSEYEQIKKHSVLGEQILSSIKQAPFLSVGARYHHERYDGRGYPDGIAGEEIPEIARIIAVADAFDAMTSMRSYRKPLEKETVRLELINGSGTQFDPRFSEIMLEIMKEEG